MHNWVNQLLNSFRTFVAVKLAISSARGQLYVLRSVHRPNLPSSAANGWIFVVGISGEDQKHWNAYTGRWSFVSSAALYSRAEFDTRTYFQKLLSPYYPKVHDSEFRGMHSHPFYHAYGASHQGPGNRSYTIWAPRFWSSLMYSNRRLGIGTNWHEQGSICKTEQVGRPTPIHPWKRNECVNFKIRRKHAKSWECQLESLLSFITHSCSINGKSFIPFSALKHHKCPVSALNIGLGSGMLVEDEVVFSGWIGVPLRMRILGSARRFMVSIFL